MNSSTATGSCLCGAVLVATETFDGTLGACHCDLCRKWAGSALLAVSFGSSPTVRGEHHVTWFRSSERAERGFCSICGTHLFVRVLRDNRHLVPPGVLDDAPEISFDHQIFIDRKPAYYTFADQTTNLTSAEVMGDGA